MEMKKKPLSTALVLLFGASTALATNLNLSVESGGTNAIIVGPGATVSYDLVADLDDEVNEGLASFVFDLTFDGGNLTPVIPGPSISTFVSPDGFTNAVGFGGDPNVPLREGDLVQIGGAQNTIKSDVSRAPFPIGSTVTTGLGAPSAPVVLAQGNVTAPLTVGTYTLSIPSVSVLANVIKENENGTPFWATKSAALGDNTSLTITVRVETPVGAAFPHDRRKNRDRSFDPTPNSAAVGYRVELLNRACSSSKVCQDGTDENDGEGCVNDTQCTDGGTCQPKKCLDAADCRVCHGGTNSGLACTIDSDCPSANEECVGGNQAGSVCTTDADCVGGVCTGCRVLGETCGEQVPPVVLGWVSQPYDTSCWNISENPPVWLAGSSCDGVNFASRVEPLPVIRVWSEPVVHIGDCEIAPTETYALSASNDNLNFSQSYKVATIEKPQGRYWGDVVGVVDAATLAWTAPNGLVNVSDVDAVIKAIIFGWKPDDGLDLRAHTTWVDIVGESPNWRINATDLQLILSAFLAATYPPVGFPHQGELADCDPSRRSAGLKSSSTATFTLVASQLLLLPEMPLDIHVFTSAVADLGAYEIALDTSGGTSGTLVLTDIFIEHVCVGGGANDGDVCTDPTDCASPGVCVPRPDYVFGSLGSSMAEDLISARYVRALNDGGIAVADPGYLATFRYEGALGAEGVFSISVRPGDDVSFMNDSNVLLIPTAPSQAVSIGMGVDCFTDVDCLNPNPCKTVSCVANQCIFGDAPSGTSCDDGAYCTPNDTCNGSGTCVGGGARCKTAPNNVCCEATQSCYNGVFPFCPLS